MGSVEKIGDERHLFRPVEQTLRSPDGHLLLLKPWGKSIEGSHHGTILLSELPLKRLSWEDFAFLRDLLVGGSADDRVVEDHPVFEELAEIFFLHVRKVLAHPFTGSARAGLEEVSGEGLSEPEAL